ncbi:hypothetical protein CSB93_0466 [Pseudomonas paraeruginosa]|uniref:Uncharacterized protein n=1 Tax=Pseudomonas paraeruginosa TaxID=2994495 RepID=A0A2R3J2D6_9PSED|nr:hypothetical protein CSB93_0466 [Pseudomonas paraeruginosa]AWE91433.1 hypothetical protein CSC28_5779 [Pseudomonas paraeruginosa]PTC34104.1 hypothetical protein CLJ1_5312 [Pseudomonas aeruginosa]
MTGNLSTGHRTVFLNNCGSALALGLGTSRPDEALDSF